jgi:hypothetical protein
MKYLQKKDIKLMVLDEYLSVRKSELCFLEELREMREGGQDIVKFLCKVNNYDQGKMIDIDNYGDSISGIFGHSDHIDKQIIKNKMIIRHSGYDEKSLRVDYYFTKIMDESGSTFPDTTIEMIKRRIGIVEGIIEELKGSKVIKA